MPCKQCFSKAVDAVFHDARIAAGLITLASLALLLGAFFFQYVLGLAPCVLCLYQRIPHAVAIVLGLVALFFAAKRRQPKSAALIILLCAVTYVISTGLAFYHTGVEHHWWVSAFEACAAPGIALDSTNLLAQLESAAAARCDTVAWEMFGISMAGYNTIISGMLAVYGVLAALLVTRRANGF